MNVLTAIMNVGMKGLQDQAGHKTSLDKTYNGFTGDVKYVKWSAQSRSEIASTPIR